ncbi:membrane protein [Pandoraea aquatica]|uniref:Membrane protein n=1 Tax=Pandoraea aquatica TaxID=2508290 RepID=A0A5E4YZ89_9BURK|nr:porin [Pandoraea aquatica]VVE53233.1 membrane protein [Pandoraea aquatica]
MTHSSRKTSKPLPLASAATIASAALLLASVAPSAHAQSSVTLYGLIESAIVSQNHASPTGGRIYSVNQAGEGFLSASRFGLQGIEDLGSGMKARFVLENGFNSQAGTFDQQGQLFGRQAFVALQGGWGELAFGRQYTGAVVAISMVDPIFIGAPPTNSWLVFLTGQRYNNALTWTKKFGPFGVNLQYAFGGIAGQGSARSSASGGVSWEQNGNVFTGQLQQTHDSQSRTAKTWSLGGKVSYGQWKFHADYLQSQRDPGFDVTNGGVDYASITNMSTAATPTTVAAIGSVFSAARRDQFFTLGATYLLSPSWQFIAAYMYNNTTAVNFSGKRQTLYGVIDYFLSKRTDVYFATAYERVDGGWGGLFGTTTTNWTGGNGVKLNGFDNQMSYYIGLRHRF